MVLTETQKRILDLSERAFDKGVYTFSDFLNETEIAEIKGLKLPTAVSFYGGADFCDKAVARLGSEKEFYYEEDFPIDVLKVSPLSTKFCKRVTHRDFLGAILNLGIDKSKVGSIFTDGVFGYVCVMNTLTAFLAENLTKVGANAVKVDVADGVPNGFKPKTEEKELIVSSLRTDAIISKVYNLSREQSLDLFREGLVAINGKPSTENAKLLTGGETVSVRGYGKFKFIGQTATTKKDKLFIAVEKYI